MVTLLITVFVATCVGTFLAQRMDRAWDLSWLSGSAAYAMLFGMVAAIEMLKRRATRADPLGMEGRRF